ncbi:MAG TPA: YdeI/OmpD-associated family protein [Jatrophihabitans sp.]|nr:YdeI/OmpD-associated family protein [Jatrophihabitans sp.]
MPIELVELLVPDAVAWRAWLLDNHADSPGVWLVLTKKGGTVTALDYAAALDEALCFGWIDGQVGRRDDETMRQRFTPRRARSAWSKRNVEHVARLTAAGLMAEPGLAAVEAAKADGRWDAAYAGPAAAEVPDDLASALRENSSAQAMWDVLTSQNRYAITYRIGQAKRADTRARRIAEFVAMLERGETVHSQKASHPRQAQHPHAEG